MQLSAAVWACWKAPLFNMSIRRAELCIARALARPLNRLLRHGVSGLGGVLGGGTGGRNAPPTASASAVAAHCDIMGLCIFFPLKALEQGGTLGGGALPPVLSFLGCKAGLLPLSFPSPLVTRGPKTKKAVKSTAYLFPVPF